MQTLHSPVLALIYPWNCSSPVSPPPMVQQQDLFLRYFITSNDETLTITELSP